MSLVVVVVVAVVEDVVGVIGDVCGYVLHFFALTGVVGGGVIFGVMFCFVFW